MKYLSCPDRDMYMVTRCIIYFPDVSMKPLEWTSTLGIAISNNVPFGFWHVSMSITNQPELVIAIGISTIHEPLRFGGQMSEELIVHDLMLASGPEVSEEGVSSIEFSKRMGSSVQGNGFPGSKSKLFLVEVHSCASIGMNVRGDFQIRGQEWTICITRWNAIRSSSFELDGTRPGDFTITLLSSEMTTSITYQ